MRLSLKRIFCICVLALHAGFSALAAGDDVDKTPKANTAAEAKPASKPKLGGLSIFNESRTETKDTSPELARVRAELLKRTEHKAYFNDKFDRQSAYVPGKHSPPNMHGIQVQQGPAKK